MISYPAEFGSVVRDLSPGEKTATKCLYVIETDDKPRDFTAPPKTYGLFWSTHPNKVNQIAISLWPKFGSADSRDCEDNILGESTKEGECYNSSACLGYGSSFLSLRVDKVDGNQPRTLNSLYKSGLLGEALDMVGISLDGMDEAFNQLVSPPWLRKEEAILPIYDIFGYPENYKQTPSNTTVTDDSESNAEKLLTSIVHWRPENKSGAGNQYVVAKVVYPTAITNPVEFSKQTTVNVFGPGWVDDANKDGFINIEEAVTYAQESVRNTCKMFDAYPKNAPSDGPWDSREMGESNAKECRVEVLTKEEFACFLHNLMVKAGVLLAPMYRPPFAPFDWCALSEGKMLLEPTRSRPVADTEEKRLVGKQYIVLKMTYPKRCVSVSDRASEVDFDLYGPKGKDNKNNHDGFLTKEEAVKYAKECVRDECEWFTDYSHYHPENANSSGPWDSAEMENPDNDDEVRIEVMMKEQFACVTNNLMITMGYQHGNLIPSPPVPTSLSEFMGWS